MDPISLTVSAIVQALLVGAARGAGEALGRDAYQALKRVLFSKYSAVQPTLESLEQNPRSQTLQEQLATMLRNMGAGNDTGLQHLTEELQHAVGYKDPVDEQKLESGFRDVQQLLRDHLKLLMNIRRQHNVDDAGLLSSSIYRATMIPVNLRSEVQTLHGKIRQHIDYIAWMIEGDKYRDAENFITRLPARHEQERAVMLVRADTNLHVSYQTLRLTVEYFSKFNSIILARLEQDISGNQELGLMLWNAIAVYELADYVIEYIRDFVPGGIHELEDLHRAELQQMNEIRDDLNRLIGDPQGSRLDPKLRPRALKAHAERTRALDIMQLDWEEYIAEASQFYDRINEAKGMIPNLEYIKEDARIQIKMLQRVSILRLLRESLRSLQGTVVALEEFRLAPLNSTRLRRLLGERK